MVRVLIAIAFIFSAAAAEAQTQWDHNGSVMTLYANGADRQFVYSTPRYGIPVSSGTVLFKGQKSGDSYSGTAYGFSSRCGPVAYSVSGPVSADQRMVTMYGKKPQRDGKCRVVGYENDVLVFGFLDPNDAKRVADDESNPTLICLRPVFIEESKLQERIDGERATTLWVAQAINHLRAKYCREVSSRPDSDDSVHVGENCYQYTGVFRGERVFWGQCHE